MKEAMIVGLGGCVGSMGRYLIGGLILHQAGSMKFPLSTFLINVAGCLLIGVLGGIGERHHITLEAKLFLMTGVLGGFTTFSAFGLETMSLLKRGDVGIAVLYAGLSVVLGISAVWTGFKAAGA